ncbi:MAG: hypothetical protein KF718_29200 [Polyangiaceae bacterium]|nr:hypothetical protein [Polyangiaceae bacterium]
MLDVTPSELVVIAFITAAVVSAPWWPRLGAALAARLAGPDPGADPGGDEPRS